MNEDLKKIRRLSGRTALICNEKEFETDTRLNRELMERFKEWHRMRKPRRL